MRRWKLLAGGSLFFIVLELLTVAGFAAYPVVKEHIPPSIKRIVVNPGGSVFEFIEDYSNDRHDNVKFIVDGPCISACTFILGEIPPQNVCVTPYAMMAFHSAYTLEGLKKKRVFDPEGNDMIWRIYPAWVRDWLRENGWDNPYVDQPTLIFMPYEVLRQHYQVCK